MSEFSTFLAFLSEETDVARNARKEEQLFAVDTETSLAKVSSCPIF